MGGKMALQALLQGPSELQLALNFESASAERR